MEKITIGYNFFYLSNKNKINFEWYLNALFPVLIDNEQ